MFGRLSCKFPSTYPNYCGPLSVTDTALHRISSNASSPNPAYISVPPSSVDVDGLTFYVRLSGRVVLSSGASPGTLTAGVDIGSGGANTGSQSTLNLPANQSGRVLPFWFLTQFYYDPVAKLLSLSRRSVLGDQTANVMQNDSMGVFAGSFDPDDLLFTTHFQFSVAPLSGTNIIVTEFVV